MWGIFYKNIWIYILDRLPEKNWRSLKVNRGFLALMRAMADKKSTVKKLIMEEKIESMRWHGRRMKEPLNFFARNIGKFMSRELIWFFSKTGSRVFREECLAGICKKGRDFMEAYYKTFGDPGFAKKCLTEAFAGPALKKALKMWGKKNIYPERAAYNLGKNPVTKFINNAGSYITFRYPGQNIRGPPDIGIFRKGIIMNKNPEILENLLSNEEKIWKAVNVDGNLDIFKKITYSDINMDTLIRKSHVHIIDHLITQDDQFRDYIISDSNNIIFTACSKNKLVLLNYLKYIFMDEQIICSFCLRDLSDHSQLTNVN
jgi:hypothetical protein